MNKQERAILELWVPSDVLDLLAADDIDFVEGDQGQKVWVPDIHRGRTDPDLFGEMDFPISRWRRFWWWLYQKTRSNDPSS